MSWPHILQNSQNCSLFSLLPANFLCSVFIEWDSLACIPACLGTLASWFLTRDDDLDCEARDVWVTPFTPILMKRYLQCSVRGEQRCGHVWNSPCASKQFLILYLHLHYSTFIQPGLRIIQLVSRVSWASYHHDITRPRPDTLAWLWLDYTNPQCEAQLGASHYFQIPQ